MIDETLCAALAKKNTILKSLYDFEKLKFQELEDKIASPAFFDIRERTKYTLPNF